MQEAGKYSGKLYVDRYQLDMFYTSTCGYNIVCWL